MFKKLFSPFGRLSRGGMWLWAVLVFSLIWVAAATADYFILGINFLDPELAQEYGGYTNLNNFLHVVFWLTLWPVTALTIKRFHDVGLSGYWYIGSFLSTNAISELLAIKALADPNSFIGKTFGATPIYTTKWLEQYVADLPVLILPSLIVVLALISIAVLVITLLMAGNVGGNKYGPDPLRDDSQSSESIDQSSPPWVEK